ncbi:MAG: YcaO-like family protein [Sulfitobacter sp.]|nr:YcaO-like family protein [Sulfitobacter sp.]
MNYRELEDHFDLIPVKRALDPCHYAFCVPNQRAYARWPAFPAAARPHSGRAAAGRGVDAAQCKASAFGEAVELASSCAWGDETLITATEREIGPKSLSPEALNGFSTRQLANRAVWNASPFAELDWCPPPFDNSDPIDWISASLLSGETCFVPADFVFVGRKNPGDANAVSIATTSGCASGETAASAKLTALLELIERDAVGQWWYGRIPRPRLPLERLCLPDEISSYLRQRTRQTVLFNLTTELSVPVVAAVSYEPDGKNLAMGFGCNPNFSQASCSAVTELFQTEIGLVQRQQQDDQLLEIWLHSASRDTLPISETTITASDLPNGGLETVVDCLTKQDRACAFVDLSRPEFGNFVFRAIVPDMWSDKPRLAGFERAGLPEPTCVLPLLV